MRPHPRTLLFAAALALLQMGCGTMANLTAPPTAPTVYRGMGPTACEPFGGVTRSIDLGGMCLAGGLTTGYENLGQGGLILGTGMVAAGSVILAVDTPLSLVADVVTLPLVYARREGMPWATWWGEQATIGQSNTDEGPPPVRSPESPEPPAASPVPASPKAGP
jgi:uncharacterized protein YceK